MKTINNPKGLGYVVGFDYKGARGTSCDDVTVYILIIVSYNINFSELYTKIGVSYVSQ